MTCEGERHYSDLPWGSYGGQDGLNASTIVNPGEPDEVRWPSKFTGLPFKAGNVIQITVPSSGGFGDPLERDPQLVLSDVLDGFTTLELAERDYGVVIDPASMTLDTAATAALRGRRGRT